jgi:hypothetical protein
MPRSKGSKSKSLVSTITPPSAEHITNLHSPDLNISANLKHALTTRLEFRKAFLTALDLDCPLGHLGHYWSPILASLTVINATQQVGKVVPGSFSTKIQRRLASTVPPRPIVELEFKDAFEKLKQLCIDCEEATRFTNLPADPLEYESFLWAYASRTPKPLPYSRAYLSTILFHPDILNSQTSPPLVDLKTLVLPCSPVVDPINWTLSPPRNPLLPKAPRLQMALLIDEFVERAGQNYLDFWTSLGQNRCRLRRMLTHVIAGWDQLQADAGLVDEDLMRAVEEMGIQDQVMKYPLTTWVYHKKLFMMEKTILLSFEQNIYLPDEFAGMYHFLSIIATKRRALLENILDHFNQRVLQHTQQNEGDVANEIKNQAGYIESLCNEASGIEHLSAALSKFYIALLYLKLLPHPSRPFSTEELRYELRMKPFLTLQPPEVPPFADFQASIEPFGPFTENNSPLLSEITNPGSQFWSTIDIHVEAVKRAFTNIKKGGAKKSKAGGVEMAWGKEIQGTLASCIALGIAVVGVKGALAGSDGLGIKVEVPGFGEGKRYHEGWVVGKVVKG